MQPARAPDFLPFYLGGKLAASGQISQLYHKPAYQPFLNELRASGVRLNDQFDANYFIRPAFEAFFYAPFSSFSFPTASVLVTLVNLALLALLVWKLPIWFSAPPTIRVGLVCFMPFIWSVGMGQDTLLLTLIVAYSLRLAWRDREVLAGCLLAVAAYKPHLIWAMPLALLATGRRKMVGSFLAAGVGLALVSFAAVGPTGVREWITLVGAPSSDIWPERMGNIRALGLHFGPIAAALAALVTLACLGILLWRGSFAQKFSAAIFAALLLSPHTYWQDYSLAAIVVALAARPLAQVLLLLPWPYFYPGKDELPFVFLSLAFLAVPAVASLLPAPLPKNRERSPEAGVPEGPSPAPSST